MGLFFTSSRWRAPLQLIDCWLPERSLEAPSGGTRNPVLQRFTRAGWLGRSAANAPRLVAEEPRVRVVRPASAIRSADARLVVSGRIDVVCAALDHLADQDARRVSRAA